jgi:hypothetical protein
MYDACIVYVEGCPFYAQGIYWSCIGNAKQIYGECVENVVYIYITDVCVMFGRHWGNIRAIYR